MDKPITRYLLCSALCLAPGNNPREGFTPAIFTGSPHPATARVPLTRRHLNHRVDLPSHKGVSIRRFPCSKGLEARRWEAGQSCLTWECGKEGWGVGAQPWESHAGQCGGPISGPPAIPFPAANHGAPGWARASSLHLELHFNRSWVLWPVGRRAGTPGQMRCGQAGDNTVVPPPPWLSGAAPGREGREGALWDPSPRWAEAAERQASKPVVLGREMALYRQLSAQVPSP